jgi:hypothetical protein
MPMIWPKSLMPVASSKPPLEEPLGRDPERSRAALIDAIGPKITLLPDESRKFLWAEHGLDAVPLVAAAIGALPDRGVTVYSGQAHGYLCARPGVKHHPCDRNRLDFYGSGGVIANGGLPAIPLRRKAS